MVTRNRRGYSLTEAMIVVAILGTVAAVGSGLFLRMYQFYNMSDARTDVQRELRVILDNMDQDIRRASAASVLVTEDSGQPPYSRINFNTVEGSTVTYRQSGHTLIRTHDNYTTTLTKNLWYVAFSYPQTDIATVVSISLTLQKSTFSGRATALQMAVSKVRIMNP